MDAVLCVNGFICEWWKGPRFGYAREWSLARRRKHPDQALGPDSGSLLYFSAVTLLVR